MRVEVRFQDSPNQDIGFLTRVRLLVPGGVPSVQSPVNRQAHDVL